VLHIVARIRSRGAYTPLSSPSSEAIAAVIAHICDEKPLSARELAEDERLWQVVDAEMREREQADDRAERLL